MEVIKIRPSMNNNKPEWLEAHVLLDTLTIEEVRQTLDACENAIAVWQEENPAYCLSLPEILVDRRADLSGTPMQICVRAKIDG